MKFGLIEGWLIWMLQLMLKLHAENPQGGAVIQADERSSWFDG